MKLVLRKFKIFSAQFRRLALYAFFGGCGVALDFIVYAITLKLGLYFQFANALGYASGTLLSFALNRHMTFQVLDAPLLRLTKFLSVAAVGFSTSWFMLWVLVDHMAIGPLPAKVLTLGVVLLLQFSCNSAWTFKLSSISSPEKLYERDPTRL